ncbi:MAG: hypothetical protein NT040_19730 [Bacteroidetes bacterium]|nr:hypothetical protein [Bacteroidota bacterium]
MKNILIFFIAFLFAEINIKAQVGINTDNSQPNSSAMLDVKSTDKGFLLPRMSQTEILAIPGPVNGLQVFCTSDSKMYIYVATLGRWKEVAYGSGTLPQFVCGNSMTIMHLTMGGIAPVDKTVTYGTVNNIPGETPKCWITRNLGASQQATEVSDGTEASAGWYWQFNRKQGFQYISSRIPNSTWINSISESLNWTTVSDPCAIELGTGWRIPTLTEWTNVIAGGSWTNWNGPYISPLKLHAAGCLSYGDGSLLNRGSVGYYWSGLQGDATFGWYLSFSSGYNTMGSNQKAYGFSIRCLRDN